MPVVLKFLDSGEGPHQVYQGKKQCVDDYQVYRKQIIESVFSAAAFEVVLEKDETGKKQ
jgi:hypothetical protein